MNTNFIQANTGIVKITKEVENYNIKGKVFKVKRTNNADESIMIDNHEGHYEILKGEYEFITEKEAKEILFNQMMGV